MVSLTKTTLFRSTCINLQLVYVVKNTFYLIFSSINIIYAGDPEEHHWDLLIFTQSWPLTVCREWKEKDQSHSCQLPNKKESWTIHGIWPTKIGTIGPAFCNKTWHFNPDAIKPIENELDQLWTNVENGKLHYITYSHNHNIVLGVVRTQR